MISGDGVFHLMLETPVQTEHCRCHHDRVRVPALPRRLLTSCLWVFSEVRTTSIFQLLVHKTAAHALDPELVQDRRDVQRRRVAQEEGGLGRGAHETRVRRRSGCPCAVGSPDG